MKNKIRKPELPKEITTPLLYRITKTLILTLVFFCLFLLTFYIVGNYQQFQDESQILILRVLFYNAIFTPLLTIPVIIEDVIMIFTLKKKIKSIVSLILMLLTIVFCVFLIFISATIDIFSLGI